MPRTEAQNKSLHLMFQMLADELNNAGLDMRKTLKPEVDISWDTTTVKNYLWRPLQKVMTRKESTTDLSSHEIDMIFGVLNRHLGEKFGVEIIFPSIETLKAKGEK